MIKLGDFGFADSKSINKAFFSTYAGTQLYMSPDVWDEKYSFNSDVWYN